MIVSGRQKKDSDIHITGKDPDAGKDEGRRRGGKQDGRVGWHHRLNAHEFEQTPEDGEGQGSLECRSPWGHKESNMA